MASRWMEIFIGSWIMISPWVLGFSDISVMRWSNLIFGAIIVVVEIWRIFSKTNTNN